MTHVAKPVKIDVDLGAYEPFFDHEWARKLDALAAPSKELWAIVFDLCVSWKGASSTARLPGQLMHLFNGFAVNFFRDTAPNTRSLKLVVGLTHRLSKRVPLTPAMQELVRKEMLDIDAEIRADLENAPVPFSAEKAWKDFLQFAEFRHCLWASQRICYVVVYNAYEDFVARCTGVAVVRVPYRMPKGKIFKQEFTSAFGADLLKLCWLDHPVAIARLARHALSHAGGRVTDELHSYRPYHGFEIEGGELQVKATDTRQLFDQLKGRVSALAEKALMMPGFQ
jgi:hypothetical protein